MRGYKACSSEHSYYCTYCPTGLSLSVVRKRCLWNSKHANKCLSLFSGDLGQNYWHHLLKGLKHQEAMRMQWSSTTVAWKRCTRFYQNYQHVYYPLVVVNSLNLHLQRSKWSLMSMWLTSNKPYLSWWNSCHHPPQHPWNYSAATFQVDWKYWLFASGACGYWWSAAFVMCTNSMKPR